MTNERTIYNVQPSIINACDIYLFDYFSVSNDSIRLREDMVY
ncbi:hypothetical protein [uncultured Lactobacillus sp.]|nr:hypothetical protein [uncultured Lactobacillus sp.]